MADVIEANYDDLESVANMFSQKFSDMDAMTRRVQACMEQLLAEGWKGLGSEKFAEEMQGEVMPALQRLCEALDEASSSTQRISNIIQQAEEEARNRVTQL